jgi:hypothetical protein
MFKFSEIEEIVAKFPGPTALLASRLRCWVKIILGGGVTAFFTFVAIFTYRHPSGVKGDFHTVLGILILCAIFFGLCTVVSVITLRISSLRLDKDGFEVIGLFRKQYRWSEVSDFGLLSYRGPVCVVFKTTEPCRNIHEMIISFFTGGRNQWLPDTYGFTYRDLAQLMKTWQSSATNAFSRS